VCSLTNQGEIDTLHTLKAELAAELEAKIAQLKEEVAHAAEAYEKMDTQKVHFAQLETGLEAEKDALQKAVSKRGSNGEWVCNTTVALLVVVTSSSVCGVTASWERRPCRDRPPAVGTEVVHVESWTRRCCREGSLADRFSTKRVPNQTVLNFVEQHRFVSRRWRRWRQR
jgi:hypothetical protein